MNARPLAALLLCASACAAAPAAPTRPSPAAAPDAGLDVVDAPTEIPVPTAALDPRVACSLAAPPAASLGRPALTFPPEARCDGICDTVDHAPRGADRCYVANDSIARAEVEALGASTAPPGRTTPWDRTTAPRWLDRVDAHLHLDPRETERLRANGFVALGRARYDSYALAYHEVFRQQLPVYVSADAILHAVFVAHGTILPRLEAARLHPALVRTLTRLRAELARSRGRLRPEAFADLDVYLTVALWLLRGDEETEVAPLAPEQAPAVAAALGAVSGRSLAAVELFGRERMVDGSQYQPRGHYADASGDDGQGNAVNFARYFEAMTWLSRLEFNVVSRGCRSSQPGPSPDPAETPREALDALSLAELAERAGVFPDLALFERTYSVFAGAREDLPLPALAALARAARVRSTDADAFDALRAAIGDRFARTASTYVMPQGHGALPVITTMFGPRVVPDIAALEALVHDRVPGRARLGFADVGYALGHDRARSYLADDLAAFPTLQAQLDVARSHVRDGARGTDLYRRWLDAVRSLAAPTEGSAPSFMRTPAWADARLNSALVGFGQIRHNYVLMAGQGYDTYGCEIPDGYVEPAVEVYDALLGFVAAARAVDPGAAGYFARVARVLRTLRAIAVTERAGRPLSEAQRRWLGMVAEYVPSGGYAMESGEPPKWTGWYFDLFPDREIGAERAAHFVADYFTLTNAGEVRYLGAETPELGVFVVDANGPPRVMVGPVARGYELAGPIAERLDDERANASPGHAAPWRASYAVPDERPWMRLSPESCGGDAVAYVLSVPGARGEAELTALDHHGDPLTAAARQHLRDGRAVFRVGDVAPNRVAELHVGLVDEAGRRADWTVPASGYEPDAPDE